MRLAYLCSRYPAVNHTYLLNEVLHLRSLGMEIHVASVLPPDRPLTLLTAEERTEAGRTFYIKPRGLGGALRDHAATVLSRPGSYFRALLYAASLGGWDVKRVLHCLLYFAEAIVLGRWMLARGLRHVHVHYSSSVGLIAQRAFPIDISNSFHGPAEFLDPAGFHLAEKISASVFVRAISQYGRSQLMCASNPSEWPKIEVVRLGVDPKVFLPGPFREHPSPCEIVSVGRLSPEKGHHVLLSAFGLLVAGGCDVRLRLVGDGPVRASLERQAIESGLAGHVVFEGWASLDRVRELYAQADICALPSFQEGIPVALMEAMAMRLPTVAARITGIPELIRDGVDGLLVTPSDETTLAAALRSLVTGPGLRARLGEAGRCRVLVDYDFARNMARLAAIFQSRLNGE